MISSMNTVQFNFVLGGLRIQKLVICDIFSLFLIVGKTETTKQALSSSADGQARGQRQASARGESHDCLALLNTLCVPFSVQPLCAVACAPRRCPLSAPSSKRLRLLLLLLLHSLLRLLLRLRLRLLLRLLRLRLRLRLRLCLHFEQVICWTFLLVFVWNKKKLALDVSANRVKAACAELGKTE